MGSKNSKPLSPSGLIKLMDCLNASELLCEEHDKIMKIKIRGTCNESTAAENVEKNRFEDNPCFDHSRVILQDEEKLGNYINASYIDGFKHPKKYIACQAPLKTTSSDFWRLIYQHKIQTIVMLCSLFENGKSQCYRYWSPEEEVTLQFGKFKITTVKVDSTNPGFTITHLEVINEDGNCLRVTHCLYEKWQEHYLSPDEISFIDLVLKIKLHVQLTSNTPSSQIVVHCNSGLERSMVFCAVDICLVRLKKTGKLDVFSTVLELRKQRRDCLFNVNHYIFIYMVMDHYIKSIPKLFYPE